MNTLKKAVMLIAVFVLGMSYASPVQAQEMSMDPEVRKGVLPNGITYYVRHNEEPKDRASFYIMQNVGAVLENDDQNGLAHFLEHMAFNGTEHFPGKGVINTVQKYGVEFGRNLNAYTSFGETVYNISEVPNNEGMMDTCLLILHDWCNFLELTEEEIDAERNVITEEWRTRRTAQKRMRDGAMSYMLKDSKYTERDVIGSLEIIQNHKYETLRNFYHDWYRTDLQGIAVVGDFDIDEMEQKIIALFSPIPAVENPLERYYIDVPFNEAPVYGLVTDKEATSTSINVTFKHEGTPKADKDLAYYRRGMITSLYGQMFSQRIQEMMQQENPPFTNAYSNYIEYLGNVDMYYISAGAKQNEEARTLKSIMIENERVRRHGFTAGELERAKMNFLASMESAYKQRGKISSDQYAKEYTRNYIDNEPIPGIAKEMEYVQQLLPTITTEEIAALAKEWISYEHMVVVISGPEAEGVSHITEEETFAIINEVKNSEIEGYKDELTDAVLLSEIPKGSKVKKTKELPILKAEEWTLKNGTKVVYRFSDIEKDRVYIKAVSKGGTSLYDVEDLPSAQMASMATQFGLGDYDPTTLQKLLAGKQASVSTSIGGISESADGSSTVQDVETMFQMLYLAFDQPRFDETLFKAKLTQIETYLEAKKNDPKAIMSDKKSMIFSDNHERTLLFNEEYMAKVDFAKMEKIYRERFADANDFIFYITGNISKEELQPLVETYIGGLNVEKGSEKWVDHNVTLPQGKTNEAISIAMETPKSTVAVKYGEGEFAYSPENILYSRLLGDILNLRFTEKVREEAGGTYGVGVGCYITQYPTSTATLSIGFDCDPEKTHELMPIIYQEIARIAENGPTAEDLEKSLVAIKKNRTQAFEKNAFWLQAMQAKYWRNLDMVSPSYKEDVIAKLTPEDIQNFAVKLLESSDFVEIIFSPEAK